MSSTTLIRVKRRRSQSPAEALLVHLAAKRKKRDDDSVDGAAKLEQPSTTASTKQVFRFAATVTDHEQGSDDKSLLQFVDSKVYKPESTSKRGSRTQPKESHTSGLSSKLHQKHKESLENHRSDSRFKVVGGRRNVNVDSSDDLKFIHLLDLVQEDEKKENDKSTPAESRDKIACNGVELEVSKCDPSEFVYDVYYHLRPRQQTIDFDIDSPDSVTHIDKIDQAMAEEIYQLTQDFFENYQDDRDMEDFGEDEDSNDESNWRNDYPDEEEYDGASDDYDEFGYTSRKGPSLAHEDSDSDLDAKFQRFAVGNEGEELSSDGEDELVYSQNFERDADLHGAAYAKYKRNILSRDYYFEAQESESDDEDLYGD